MRAIAAGALLLLFLLVAGQARATGSTRWSDRSLKLGLSYPKDWHVVAERGAALKMVAPDAAAEFEILPLASPLSPGALSLAAVTALTHLHCRMDLKQSYGPLGRLDASAAIARGSCTGGDLGWTVTVAAVNTGTRAVLIRSWLFHGQPRDGASLQAITASLSPNA